MIAEAAGWPDEATRDGSLEAAVFCRFTHTWLPTSQKIGAAGNAPTYLSVAIGSVDRAEQSWRHQYRSGRDGGGGWISSVIVS